MLSKTFISAALSAVIATCYSASAFAQSAQELARFDVLVDRLSTATIMAEPELVECTLSEGAQSYCLKVTVMAAPADHITGPFCPRTTADGAEDGGKWFVDGELRDVDGKFITELANIFNDENWQMYDPETGLVYFTGGVEGCVGAGNPNGPEEGAVVSDVGPGHSNPINTDPSARAENICVECEIGYIGANVTHTYFIPLSPSEAEHVGGRMDPRVGVGLAFNGVKLDGAAPLELIYETYTLGPLDDCAGHINPIEGYHYHGVVDGCGPRIATADADHASIIGVAMDGYDIYDRLGKDGVEPNDLDACRGHETEELGYHYHVNGAGTNQILPCFSAQTGCGSEDPNATCDASIQEQRPPRPED